jgi:TonB-dependent SusC/RagA subfamily outer membrane receptor
LFSIPLKNCKVKLSVSEEFNDVFTQYTGKGGLFKFENMVYYDTINVKIEAWRNSGRRNLVIYVPDNSFAEVTKQQGEYTLTTVSERDKKAYRREQYVKNKIAYDEQQRRIASADSNKLHGIHGEPDAVIRSEDIPSGYSNIFQVLQGRVPGVVVTGNKVVIRGVGTFYGSTDPLYLIDGVPVNDASAVLSIPVEDIDRIEIIKGPNSAIYGSRGGNGVIAIYTKRGFYLRKGIMEFQMLGYQWPRKFYQPVFAAGESPDDAKTIGWFPVVVTDDKGNAKAIIRKPEIQGKLRVIIEGISYDGHAGYTDVVVENN